MAVKVEYMQPVTNPIKEVQASCSINSSDTLIISDCSGGNVWIGVKYGPGRDYPVHGSFSHPGVSLTLDDARELHTLLGKMLDHAKA